MLDISNILKSLKGDLKEALGEKLSEVILFGSYSRGDFTQYSDIDLLILIDSELGKEETQIVDDLIASYSLRYDVVISGIVYPAEAYRLFNTPFLQNVKEEGTAI
jgi:predicted nucleotidyltransferase